ncbi:MAG: hypothetical protein ACI4J0_06675 [Huintestinicola sp.]|uniref:hypothetical protein n=1 Tax=Huintestinicola sp. TaxID=2981661 RepID=UPI003EFD6AF4
MKKLIMIFLTVLALTACAKTENEPPEETDIITDTKPTIMTETEQTAKPPKAETTETEPPPISFSPVTEETVTSETAVRTEPPVSETEPEPSVTQSTEAPSPAKLSFRIKMTDSTRGELCEDAFFGKKGDLVDITVPKGMYTTDSGEIILTLSENAAIMETYPCQISEQDIENIEPVSADRFTITVAEIADTYIIGTLNEYTFFADRGEKLVVNVPAGNKFRISNIIEVELDSTAEITDLIPETPDSSPEEGSKQISGSYSLRIIAEPVPALTSVSEIMTETETSLSSWEIAETTVTERYADYTFTARMTSSAEGVLTQDTFFGKSGDRFQIDTSSGYIPIYSENTDISITLWNDAYIGITSNIIIPADAVYSIDIYY